MKLVPNPRVGLWFVTAFTLVLGLAGVLTGVAIVQGEQQQQAAALEDRNLPALRLVQQLTQQVDDARGMEALHLLLRSDSEMRALQAQVGAMRQRLDAQVKGYEARTSDTTEREPAAAVRQALATYWATQDQLFAAAQQALDNPAAAEAARQLLTGSSHQAWRQVQAALQAWFTHAEQRAQQQAKKARLDATQALWRITQLAAALAMAAVVAVLLLWRAARHWRGMANRTGIAAARGGEDTRAGRRPEEATAQRRADEATAVRRVARSRIAEVITTIEGMAPQASALALSVATAAARAGASGRDLSVVAAELRTMALHAAEAARALKAQIGLGGTAPAATVSAFGALAGAASERLQDVTPPSVAPPPEAVQLPPGALLKPSNSTETSR